MQISFNQTAAMSQTQIETLALDRSSSIITQYTQALETSYDLDWADLATLDLSKFHAPGGKQELAVQLQKAIQQIGKHPQWKLEF